MGLDPSRIGADEGTVSLSHPKAAGRHRMQWVQLESVSGLPITYGSLGQMLTFD